MTFLKRGNDYFEGAKAEGGYVAVISTKFLRREMMVVVSASFK